MQPSPATAGRPSAVSIGTALLTVYLVWGSTYLAIAIVVDTLPPLIAAGIRFLIAGGLVIGWCWWRGAFRDVRPTPTQWASATVVGALLLLGGNGMVMLAERSVPSGVTALLIGTVPIWLAVLDAVVNRRGVSRLVVFGLLAGLTGVAILVLPGSQIAAIDPLGAGMAVAASLSWAAGSLYARGAALPRSQLAATGMQMLTGGALLGLAGLAFGEARGLDAARFSTESLLALGYLVIAGSLVGFTAYIWLLQHAPTSTVATYAYVNPVVAVALGWAVLDEPITPQTLIAAAIIIGAVAAMVRGRPQTPVSQTQQRRDAPSVPAALPRTDAVGD